MPTEETRATRKLPVLKVAVFLAVVAAAGFLALRGVDYRALAERGMALIRGAGPWTFFLSIAVLPALGAPLSAFTIVAGEAFGPRMTTPGVIAAASAAIAVNLALTYWLARYALRPLLLAIAQRYGYSVPKVSAANALSITLMLRLTPGPPFFMQSYILGLAEAPFRMYMLISWICIMPWTIALVILGKGVFNGDFKVIIYGVGIVVAASAAFHLVRKRYARTD
jgi:uncharacterized membrane protein YdjX (TVP38/TMEM64 family)